jgi:transposase-like protein
MKCPVCQSDKVDAQAGMYWISYKCLDCGHGWIERNEGIIISKGKNHEKFI